MRAEYCSIMSSVYGRLVIFSTSEGIKRIALSDIEIEERENDHISLCKKELNEFFEGRLTDFGVSLDISKHSIFHQNVWNILKTIPYGSTCSYMDIAKKLDNPKAIRAVGRANGANPIPFIIPCHRVIGSNGSLTGYVWGLNMKRKLLAMENPKTFGLQKSLF